MKLRVTGLEPARGYHQNLNLARLPIPPHPHSSNEHFNNISNFDVYVKCYLFVIANFRNNLLINPEQEYRGHCYRKQFGNREGEPHQIQIAGKRK